MNDSKIKILKDEVLSDNWYLTRKVTFDFLRSSGEWQTQAREVFDRGNGATLLLYNSSAKTVILTRQFRIPTYLNGNKDGMMIEACAGALEIESPENCVLREAEEEVGYRVPKARKLFEAYMSPGAVTEIIYFYAAEYDASMKISSGGGQLDEQEDIEVLEIGFTEALKMIESGEIKDAKTIMLLMYAQINNFFPN